MSAISASFMKAGAHAKILPRALSALTASNDRLINACQALRGAQWPVHPETASPMLIPQFAESVETIENTLRSPLLRASSKAAADPEDAAPAASERNLLASPLLRQLDANIQRQKDALTTEKKRLEDRRRSRVNVVRCDDSMEEFYRGNCAPAAPDSTAQQLAEGPLARGPRTALVSLFGMRVPSISNVEPTAPSPQSLVLTEELDVD